MKIKGLLVSALVLLLVSSPLLAQQVASNLTGLVTDPQGRPVEGATVEIVHQPTGTVRTSQTRASGRYAAQGLRVGGPYRITISREGYDAQVMEDVHLRLGETETVDFEIADASDLERMVVTGVRQATIFQADNMGTGTTITSDQIQSMPSISRSINDYARMDPRVTIVDKERGELSVAGGHNRFNNVTIDAVAANDAFGLNANAQPSVRQPISVEWLEEISVQVNPYDVTQTGATGGQINSVTKSGTNEFSGSVYGIYRDDRFVGRSFPEFEEYTYGFTLGGPILRDRLFFFVGYEFANNDDVAAAQTGLRGSGLVNEFDLAPADVDRVINIASSQYGIDIGTAAVAGAVTNDQENWMAKVDWEISRDHRASLRYTESEGTEANFFRNNSNFDLTSRFFDQVINYDSWALHLFSDWSANFSTEFRGTRARYQSRFDNASRLPQVAIVSDAGTLRFGTEQFRHNNELDADTDQLFLKANYFTGAHSIDFGADWTREKYDNMFLESNLGVYTFDSIDAFEDGTDGVFYSLRVSADPNNPDLPRAIWDWEVLGLFLQDNWQITPNLAINAGLRYETFKTGDEPLRNEVFEQTYGFSNQGTIDGVDVWQPRVGFNWSPDLGYAAQLRGGVGLFRGRNPGVWLSNPFTNPGGTIAVFTCNSRGDSTGCTDIDPDFQFSGDPDNQPRLGATTPSMDVDVMEDGFKLPSEWKASLAWDMEMPGLTESVLTLEVGKAWTRDGMFWTHENLGPVQGQLPDGRDHYWADVANASGPRAGADAAFNDVIMLRNTDKGDRTHATLSLDKTWRGDWGRVFGRISYNYGSARDVSPGTSSRAISSWGSTHVFNVNEEVSNRSIYEIGNRLSLLLSYEANWLPFGATRFSTFLEHRDGRRYSWTFNNDANGDRGTGSNAHDLLYVPSGPGDVLFVDAAGNPDPAGETAFFELVENVGTLRNSMGAAVPGYGDRSSKVTQMDLSIRQDVNFGRWGTAQVFFDIENFTNLLNKNWGAIDQVPFSWRASPVDFMGVDPETGQYRYRWLDRGTQAGDYESRQDGQGQSRWRAQVGLRFEF